MTALPDEIARLRAENIQLRSALRRATCDLAGDQVRRFRMGALMTQADLAELVGIGAPYLSKIEQGKEQPSESVRLLLAHTLRVDLDDLLEPLPWDPA